MRPLRHRLAIAATLISVVAAPLALAQAAGASETIENFNNAGEDAYDSGATADFSLDGITYTITKTGALADNGVTEDPDLQMLADENASDNALLFDEDGIGGISAITITMTDGRAFDIQSLDIDVIADANITFLADGQSTGVSVVSDGEFAAQTVELAGANSAFADCTSITIVGADLEAALGHIVYSEVNPPVVITTGSSTNFTSVDSSTGAAVAVDSGVTVSDGESATLASGTVSVTSNFHSGQDVLGFTNTSATTYGNISASYASSTGVLTLTSSGATATLAQWQRALQAVTYLDTAAQPSVGSRTISFSVNDGTATSTAATKAVVVFSPPIVTTTGGTTTYAAGASAASVDAGIAVSDPSQATQASGTASVTAGFHSGDTLAFANTSAALFGNIQASYNSGTGVLTLTSVGETATDAQWANALESVTFAAGEAATLGDRTVAFVVDDGTDNSAAATKTVNVEFGGPVVTTSGGSTSFTAGDNVTSTPVAVDPSLTVSDPGSSTLASATASITGNLRSSEDVLAFTNAGATTDGNVQASYNSGTGVLTLDSAGATATLAQWQAALRAVTYTDTAITPDNAARTVTFQVNDGTEASPAATKTVTVADTDQTPLVATSGATTLYEAGAPATTVDGGVTVSDLDNATQAAGTVSVTTGFHSGDTLAFANTGAALFGNILASFNASTGVLTLTSAGATATDAQWADAFSAVGFSTASASAGDRTVSFVVNDGTENSAAATDTVDVLAGPVVTTSTGSTSFTAGDNVTSTPVAVDPSLTVSDPGSSTLASATASITGNLRSSEDVLAFTNAGATTDGNVQASYNSGTGVLTLDSAGATATLAQWQAALRAVTYTDTAITPDNAARTVTFQVNDGTEASSAATKTVTVADTDQTPLVATSTGATAFVAPYAAQGSPTLVDPGITVSDRGHTTLASATATVTSNFDSSQDVLGFTNTSSTAYGNIGAAYDASTGVLTLTSPGAAATVAQWQAALRSVTYDDTSSRPSGSTRSVSFVVNDGTEDSAGADKSVTVSQAAPPSAPPASASTVTSLSSPSGPITVGHEVALHVTVTPPPAGGTVTLTVGGTTVAGCGGLSLDASGQLDCSYTPSSPGSQVIQATYSGDQAFSSSTGSLTETVSEPSASGAPSPNSGPPGRTSPPSPCGAAGSGGNVTFVCLLYEDLFGRPRTRWGHRTGCTCSGAEPPG